MGHDAMENLTLNNIPSYPEATEQDLFIMVETRPFSNIYNQVKITDKQFQEICKIINKASVGFDLTVYDEDFEIISVVDYEND